ncbi:MAG: N-acyl homoserine lactonase family protein [Arenicella sp.]
MILRLIKKKQSQVMITVAALMLSGYSVADTPIQSTGKTQLKMYVLDCGTIEARDVSLFNHYIPKNTHRTLANACYLIKHPEKGMMLWDTGVTDEAYAMEGGFEILGGAFKMTVSNPLIRQLGQIGANPDNIEYLALSHFHYDHAGNAKLFPDSQWLVQKAERFAAYAEGAEKYGYNPSDYKIDNAKNIKDLSGNYDVFGDGSVIIVATPGHSPGHQSLFVDLPKTGPVILSGDLYHFEENRRDYINPEWNDKKRSIKSFVLIDDLLDTTNAQLWIQHDKKQFDSLKLSPHFYE